MTICPKPGMIASGVGFALLDATLQPIYHNEATLQVFAYPEDPTRVDPFNGFIGRRLRELLANELESRPTIVKEWMSGRRRYVLRAFRLHGPQGDPGEPAIALLLERARQEPLVGPEVADRFGFTTRELQTVEFLMLGLSSKEIAERMAISPNTVKAFMRIVMAKTHASSRTGVIGRVLEAKQHLTVTEAPDDRQPTTGAA